MQQADGMYDTQAVTGYGLVMALVKHCHCHRKQLIYQRWVLSRERQPRLMAHKHIVLKCG